MLRAPHAPGAARAAPLRRHCPAPRPATPRPAGRVGPAPIQPRPVPGWQRKGRGQAWERGDALAAPRGAIKGAGACAAQCWAGGGAKRVCLSVGSVCPVCLSVRAAPAPAPGLEVFPCPPTPQGLLLRQLPLPGFLYVRPRLQPYEVVPPQCPVRDELQVIPEDLSLPNPGADASPSLLQCRTPAFQDPFPTDGNEGFSSPFSLGLACCRCVSPVERASNRRGVLLAISG